MRRVRGSAAREQQRLGDQLRRGDELQDQRHEEHVAHGRQRDVADLLPDRGAVDLGGVVQLRSHAQQRGQVDDHRAAGGRPRRFDDDRGHRRGRVLQPGDGPKTHPTEDRVEHTARGCFVEEPPQQHGHDRRHDHRQVGESAEQAATAPDLAHQHAEDDRHRKAEHQRQRREPGRVPDGEAELRVGQDAREILEADEGRIPREVRLLHAHHGRPEHREPGEQPEDDEEWQQEDERAQAFAVQAQARDAAARRRVGRGGGDVRHGAHGTRMFASRSVPGGEWCGTVTGWGNR